MRERGQTFKQTVNDAIRAGMSPPVREPVDWPTYSMGKPRVDITKALQLSGELEDQEIIRKMGRGRPTRRHLPLLRGLLAESATAGNLVNDAHLATLALEHDATVVSFDSDFERFAGVRSRVPA